ncbi:hypothetical protein BPA30113_00855 [Burkholderia paludis]|uniref:Uncharacterized protein n=1 Tax=Burkholderia paludis TaxID=1506587 RepID=A0A6J5CZI0_9BURK|nr:hypothetical protein LMG30113_00170 [Burkholderia paludis]VWB24392.1 hypothetical protein BPA30113_00855 [Burkholderia paludis]
MQQALPGQPRAHAFDVTYRAISGPGFARLVSMPQPAIVVARAVSASMAAAEGA